MQHLAALLLGLALSVHANVVKRQYYGETEGDSEGDYLTDVCTPTNDTGYPDFNAPCNQIAAITAECIYGAAGLAAFTGDDSSDNQYGSDDDLPTLDNSTQRDCVCESQYFVAFDGCNNCFAKHGAAPITEDLENGYVPQSIIAPISSSYCAVSNTPTLGFADVLYAFATGSVASSIESVASTATATSSFSDPIGNATAVSLYYTPSITGSSAWVVAQATITPSNSTITSGSGSASGSSEGSSTSVATDSNGEIVATAGVTSTASASGSASGTASGSSTASSTAGSGAGKHEAAAVAGVIAFAGFVAML